MEANLQTVGILLGKMTRTLVSLFLQVDVELCLFFAQAPQKLLNPFAIFVYILLFDMLPLTILHMVVQLFYAYAALANAADVLELAVLGVPQMLLQQVVAG